jgi:hypothetical protein
MSTKEMQIQANLMVEKTLYDYLEVLQDIYLVEDKSWKQKETSSIHLRFLTKMKMINYSAKKYGIKDFKVFYFANITGNT